jgi:hypothetical protein
MNASPAQPSPARERAMRYRPRALQEITPIRNGLLHNIVQLVFFTEFDLAIAVGGDCQNCDIRNGGH